MRSASNTLIYILLLAIALVGFISDAFAEISRGRQIILDKGLQLQAVVITEDDNDNWAVSFPGFIGFSNANQFLDANFTTVNFWHTDTTTVKADFQAQVGSRPWQWGRIYQKYFAHDLTPGEMDYIDNFTFLSYERLNFHRLKKISMPRS